MNGLYITHLSFEDVITLLKAQVSAFIYLRFLRWSYGEDRKEGDIVSQYFDEKSEVMQSRRPPTIRSIYKHISPLYYNKKIVWCSEYYNNYKREIIGIYNDENVALQSYENYMMKLENSKYIESNNDDKDNSKQLGQKTIKSDTDIQAEKLLKKIVLQERTEGIKRLEELLPIHKEQKVKTVTFDEKLKKEEKKEEGVGEEKDGLEAEKNDKMDVEDGIEEFKNEIHSVEKDVDKMKLIEKKENVNKIGEEEEEDKGDEETKDFEIEEEIENNEKSSKETDQENVDDKDSLHDGKIEKEKVKVKDEKDEGEEENKDENEDEDEEPDDDSMDSQDSDSLLASSEEEEDEVMIL